MAQNLPLVSVREGRVVGCGGLGYTVPCSFADTPTRRHAALRASMVVIIHRSSSPSSSPSPSPSKGGWVADAATGKFVPGGRGESYGFGVAFSLDGQYWSDGVDVALPGGCRTPLGMLEDDGDGGAGDGASFTLVFTRRFADCAQQILPPGSRGDGANDKTMCANLYTARFNVSWGAWV